VIKSEERCKEKNKKDKNKNKKNQKNNKRRVLTRFSHKVKSFLLSKSLSRFMEAVTPTSDLSKVLQKLFMISAIRFLKQ
jgi:hypothetical protein